MDNFRKLRDQISNQVLKEGGFVEDLQQKELLISAMQIAEERMATLTAIVESSDDAIVSKNLSGIVTSWNKSAQRIFGFTAEEMIGEPILKLIPEDRLDEEPRILARISAGERVDHFETKRVTKYGTLIDVSLTISPVRSPSGEIIGVSKIARDITDKKLEEQRKNDFIAIVSHELKTPLTSVKSYVQFALSKVKKSGDTFTEGLLIRAEAQTQKMAILINDFLNLSRLEEGKMSINCSRFSLHELMTEIIAEGRMLAPDHQIEYESCQDGTINADRDKIGQVLNNLLNNAVKYSIAGSRIHVSCSLATPEMVLISVADQGMGISDEDQKRLFERFYRVADDKMKNISGFGIGLYLISEILKLHGSKIKVESQLGKGSVFSFALPIEA